MKYLYLLLLTTFTLLSSFSSEVKGVLIGRVTDREGQGVAGCKIYLLYDGNRCDEVPTYITDETGQFKITVEERSPIDPPKGVAFTHNFYKTRYMLWSDFYPNKENPVELTKVKRPFDLYGTIYRNEVKKIPLKGVVIRDYSTNEKIGESGEKGYYKIRFSEQKINNTVTVEFSHPNYRRELKEITFTQETIALSVRMRMALPPRKTAGLAMIVTPAPLVLAGLPIILTDLLYMIPAVEYARNSGSSYEEYRELYYSHMVLFSTGVSTLALSLTLLAIGIPLFVIKATNTTVAIKATGSSLALSITRQLPLNIWRKKWQI